MRANFQDNEGTKNARKGVGTLVKVHYRWKEGFSREWLQVITA